MTCYSYPAHLAVWDLLSRSKPPLDLTHGGKVTPHQAAQADVFGRTSRGIQREKHTSINKAADGNAVLDLYERVVSPLILERLLMPRDQA